MTQQARYFECERRITVYNARTDTIILYAEGYMDIENGSNNELIVMVKTGANEYKKNYIYLNEYTLYVVEILQALIQTPTTTRFISTLKYSPILKLNPNHKI